MIVILKHIFQEKFNLLLLKALYLVMSYCHLASDEIHL